METSRPKWILPQSTRKIVDYLCLLAGLRKYYWLDIPLPDKKHQKMGLGPT